jgi:KUP system potassium uptake protein
MTVGILVLLFAVQRFGTDKVGYLFAPVVLLWLLLIGGVGVYNLVKHDVGVLRAFNPRYIIDYFCRNGKDGWVSLGGVLLYFTGTEALFADLGYFSIRTFPAAFLSCYPETVANTLYESTHDALFWPTFVLTLAASVIGKVLHTARQYQGQLYIPEVNLLLAVAACVVTLAARTNA